MRHTFVPFRASTSGKLTVLQRIACRLHDEFLKGKEVALLALRLQAEGNGRHLLHACLERCPYGTAIVNADGSIVAVVDAAHHEVRLPCQQSVQRQLHTVGRRSAALVDGQPVFLFQKSYDDGGEGRYATGSSTSRPVGSHHNDIAQAAHHSGQLTYALCLHAIVVRDEY